MWLILTFIHLSNYLKTRLEYLRCNSLVCVLCCVQGASTITQLSYKGDIVKGMTDNGNV